MLMLGNQTTGYVIFRASQNVQRSHRHAKIFGSGVQRRALRSARIKYSGASSLVRDFADPASFLCRVPDSGVRKTARE